MKLIFIQDYINILVSFPPSGISNVHMVLYYENTVKQRLQQAYKIYLWKIFWDVKSTSSYAEDLMH